MTSMKITKFAHSCLLVETPERTALFNPGIFSWQSGTFDTGKLTRLDEILITHEHKDHLHLPFVQVLRERFPDASIYTTPAVATILKGIEFFHTEHHSLAPMFSTPQHTGFHYLGELTDPGDTHDFTEHKRVLALPVTAPWGGLIQAAAVGERLRPEVILPIHDWHWNGAARADAYDTLEEDFGGLGVKFIKPIDGEPFSA
jgi:L-ascorbate metabolism protein UlaG (beta-lactamase superfamily)